MENEDFTSEKLDLDALNKQVIDETVIPEGQRAFLQEFPLIERVPGFAEYLDNTFEKHKLPGIKDYLLDVKVDASGTAVFLYDHQELESAEDETDIRESRIGSFKDGQEFSDEFSKVYFYQDGQNKKLLLEGKIEELISIDMKNDCVIVLAKKNNNETTEIRLSKKKQDSEIRRS